MMLRAIFDERRRGEIREALKNGAPLAFRKREPAVGRMERRMADEALAMISAEAKQAFFDKTGKPIEQASAMEIIEFIGYGENAATQPITYDDIAKTTKPLVMIPEGGYEWPGKNHGTGGKK